MGIARQLPESSIMYNLEQVRHVPAAQIPEALHFCCQRFEIWEYSDANMVTWKALDGCRVKLVPIGYAPTLSRIRSAERQDIDVLMYGQSGEKRLLAFHALAQAGLAVAFACGLYGSDRDQLIAHSRIILNVNLCDEARIFEFVRVSFLFANRKAVVATMDPNTYIDADVAAAVKFTTAAHFADDCRRILDDDAERARLEALSFDTISKRDIRTILVGAGIQVRSGGVNAGG
jgi:hypothetical protein